MNSEERLAWNLAGCTTIAESETPHEFNKEFALPGLIAVNKMAEKLVEHRKAAVEARAALAGCKAAFGDIANISHALDLLEELR